MPCFSDAEVAQAHDRIALQRTLGLKVEWLSCTDIDDRQTGPRAGRDAWRVVRAGRRLHRRAAQRARLHRGSSPRAASTSASAACSRGLRTSGGRVVGVDTSDGPIDNRAGRADRRPAARRGGRDRGGADTRGRHPVIRLVVTAPLQQADVYELPMVFDITSGIYWRPGESGGLLWGMSNPDEPPGVATDFDTVFYRKARDRIEELLPRGARTRAATGMGGDHRLHTPDHLPILGPLLTDDGPIAGSVVASPAGHGMMWGPAVAQVAADPHHHRWVRVARSH